MPVGNGTFNPKEATYSLKIPLSTIYVLPPGFEPSPPPLGSTRVVDDTTVVCWLYLLYINTGNPRPFSSQTVCSVMMVFYPYSMSPILM